MTEASSSGRVPDRDTPLAARGAPISQPWCPAAAAPISPGPRLVVVTGPTLLIVGGHHKVVLDRNRRTQAGLPCENHLAIVPGTTRLFQEPGTLAAAGLAREWFTSHLSHSQNPAA